MSRTDIQNATDRLRVLALQTITQEQRENRRITEQEHLAIPEILDELHRLHVAVSEQKAEIERITSPTTPPQPSRPKKGKHK